MPWKYARTFQSLCLLLQTNQEWFAADLEMLTHFNHQSDWSIDMSHLGDDPSDHQSDEDHHLNDEEGNSFDTPYSALGPQVVWYSRKIGK